MLINKKHLLDERKNIINALRTDFGIDKADLIYGSVILSILELMVKMKINNYKGLKKLYLQDAFVKEAISKTKYIHKLSFDIPLFL